MITYFRWWLLLFLGSSVTFTYAQLSISSPVARMVFQRSSANQAIILVSGSSPAGSTTIEARFIPLAVGQGEATAWTSLPLLPGAQAYRGSVTVTAGWYRLDVRAMNGNTVLAQTSVNRVGVGEVFVIAGQSNVFGGFQRVPSAADDRVSCVDFRQDSLSEQLLPLRFSRVSYGSSIGPSQPPHIWAALGDQLVHRLNVPVLFLGASLGGTSSNQWCRSANGLTDSTLNSAVYLRLGAVLLHYVRRTGARAILWHQGESDLTTTNQDYFDNIRQVIQKSRRQLGDTLPWMVSRVSLNNNLTNPEVIAAQNRLINELPAVFAGPATDSLSGPLNRPDGLHLSGAGFVKFVNTWNQCLNDTFFQTARPCLPTKEQPLITSGYIRPLIRRPGDTIAAASVRSNPHLPDTQYAVQLLRADNGVVVAESPPGRDNPLMFTLPVDLPDGQYQLRTVSTNPALIGTPGEPFFVSASAPLAPPQTILRQPEMGGLASPALQRVGYRYEPSSHSFFAMVQATTQVEVRLERTDGGPFTESDWYTAPPSSEAPDFDMFADFNYLRNYPPIRRAVGGVPPGRYRLSVRQLGDTGPGLWFEMQLLKGRNILYAAMEPVATPPPVLTLRSHSALTPCINGSVQADVQVEGDALGSDNVYSVRLSDSNGSFANETILATSPHPSMTVDFPHSLPSGRYRLRVSASDPAVVSAPTASFNYCPSADLSLTMLTSSRVIRIGEPVTLTLTVTNNGPAAAGDIVVQSVLPPELTFVEALSSAVTESGGTLTTAASTLSAGAHADFVVRLLPSQAGTYRPAAQIIACSAQDPDSTPGSGTGDGQDDMALLDLRTSASGSGLFISPNPNQVPLPLVESNQPPVDPVRADLDIVIAASTLVPRLNQPFALSLTVGNAGGLAAGNVEIQTRLPDGWQLTNSAGLTVSEQTVTGTLSGIAAGSRAALVLWVQASQAGTVQAQVRSASEADPDSTPGNGYTNGEDDESSLTLRVRP